MRKDYSTKLAAAEAAVERWQRRVVRSVNALDKAIKVHRRLVRAHGELVDAGLAAIKHPVTVTSPVTKPAQPDTAAPVPPEVAPAEYKEPDFGALASQIAKEANEKLGWSPTGDLDIPVWMQRKLPNAADDAARAEIVAKQSEKKKRRAEASKAKSKAKFAGDLKRMPPSGKDALRRINK